MNVRPKKIKRLFAPFGLKIGRVGRSIFIFFFNLDTEEMQGLTFASVCESQISLKQACEISDFNLISDFCCC